MDIAEDAKAKHIHLDERLVAIKSICRAQWLRFAIAVAGDVMVGGRIQKDRQKKKASRLGKTEKVENEEKKTNRFSFTFSSESSEAKAKALWDLTVTAAPFVTMDMLPPLSEKTFAASKSREGGITITEFFLAYELLGEALKSVASIRYSKYTQNASVMFVRLS